MAVAESTINKAVRTTAGCLIKWSSIATGANNVYFDMEGVDGSKVMFLVASLNSTDVGTTGGYLYFGTSNTATTGSSYGSQFSGTKLNRFKVKCSPPTTEATEALVPSTAAVALSMTAFGPFETARLKDTDGYINVCKADATSDSGRVKIAAILIP